ncbi:protein of unknown function [Blastococcus saxobsidens DD2]|uniref:Uncharacterized protein n=1 Tax=Blastococcus saxobsidens (strain DD2) TaxID=1146883 RepID=H6RR70_BLASD|nr:protein of unknown function [Blastococcus saxobsidens DD2]
MPKGVRAPSTKTTSRSEWNLGSPRNSTPPGRGRAGVESPSVTGRPRQLPREGPGCCGHGPATAEGGPLRCRATGAQDDALEFICNPNE